MAVSPSSPLTATAPPLAVRLADGQFVTLESFAGEAIVLAFFDAGIAPDRTAPDELEAIRAELRGLGAALILISGGSLWSFRPDEETQVSARVDNVSLGELCRRFGVLDGTSAVFVLDAAQAIWFARSMKGTDATFLMLLDALSAAGRAQIAGRTGPWQMTRRQLLLGGLVTAFSATFLDGCHVSPPVIAGAIAQGEEGDVDVTLTINGTPRTLRLDPRVTLLDALRERLGLWGTKKGCDQGQCGACTVLVEGRRVNACLTLAVAAEGYAITTIEGLAREGEAPGDELHPLQRAFIIEDGFQCGYCTSGQIMSACGLLSEHREAGAGDLGDEDIREGMSGNLCRCGAYPNIVAAIRRASKEA
jgi:xanthine dehydrogenase YagT iron-sulfur-binding subunit